MSKLVPIPQIYKNVRYRSRTEARWALVFESLAIEAHHEPEGFELDDGRYLPDFWLPRVTGGAYFEVKGEEPSGRDLARLYELAWRSEKLVIVRHDSISHPRMDADRMTAFVPNGSVVTITKGYRWALCPSCGHAQLIPGRSLSWCSKCIRSYQAHPHLALDRNAEEIVRAYERADRWSFWNPPVAGTR